MLAKDQGDRTAIMYKTKNDLWDERKNFEVSLAYVSETIPRLSMTIDTVCNLAEDFVMWEYATAMCGYLMEVCPFDQPTRGIRQSGHLAGHRRPRTESDFVQARSTAWCWAKWKCACPTR